MLAFTFTISPLALGVSGMLLGMALSVYAIYRVCKKPVHHSCGKEIILTLFGMLMSMFFLGFTIVEITGLEQKKIIAAREEDLPDPWLDLYYKISESGSPQLKEIVLRKSLENFDCSNTLPPAGFDRFMSTTDGEAASILEPCLRMEKP